MAAPRFSRSILNRERKFRPAHPQSPGAQMVLPLKGKRVRLPVATTPDLSEAEIQQHIVSRLRGEGFEVLVTSRRRSRPRCPHCMSILTLCQACHRAFRWLVYGDGCDKGLADLLVTKLTWPHGCWLALEIKGPKTRLTLEQKSLAARRRIFIARSWDEALEAVRQFEAGLAGDH